jgi:ATP-dependent exoDNAse (exonuclease V) alpha subunit
MSTAPVLEFNPKFEKALNLLNDSSKHLFITGKAGTGKSTLLNHFRVNTNRKHVVLAPTGIAAVNIDGETIHSFFAIHPGINPVQARKEGGERKNVSIFKNLEMIVIDEISMVRADLLDAVDQFLRAARRNEMPFGGIQMVFIGDLYQLPPVVTNEEREIFQQLYQTPYFFHANVMREVFLGMFDSFDFIELDTIYRQTNPEFIDILNSIRTKRVSYSHIERLNKQTKEASKSENYIYLVATNQQADEINNDHLKKLRGQEFNFSGDVYGEYETKALPADQDLSLKVGARVMFVKNDPDGRWINGTLGTVCKIEDDIGDSEVEVEIDNGKRVKVEPVTWQNYRSTFNNETKQIEKEEIGSFTQLPLRLAWAITIHKSQGKTFNNVVIDLGSGAFAHGQTYVALSRCRSLEGLILKRPIRDRDIIMDDRINLFISYLNDRYVNKQDEWME